MIVASEADEAEEAGEAARKAKPKPTKKPDLTGDKRPKTTRTPSHIDQSERHVYPPNGALKKNTKKPFVGAKAETKDGEPVYRTKMGTFIIGGMATYMAVRNLGNHHDQVVEAYKKDPCWSCNEDDHVKCTCKGKDVNGQKCQKCNEYYHEPYPLSGSSRIDAKLFYFLLSSSFVTFYSYKILR